ncbi:hypothetical protein EJ110_NYTH55178 [Nymphaea thermarum]|nr:hypothetical protein EJ110_NYTH55178 [Nymphaea thermarum]
MQKLFANRSAFADFKNLRSLEVCGGGITDAEVNSIRELTCLTHLNLSQNCNLTDKALESISGVHLVPAFLLCKYVNLLISRFSPTNQFRYTLQALAVTEPYYLLIFLDAGLTALVSLNASSSRVTNLRSLSFAS